MFEHKQILIQKLRDPSIPRDDRKSVVSPIASFRVTPYHIALVPLKEQETHNSVSCPQFAVFAHCQIERAFRSIEHVFCSIVIANEAQRSAAISIIAGALFFYETLRLTRLFGR